MERIETAGLLSIEREETDKDLSTERARSDDLVATRDEFLGIVSHDLRNMLNAISGLAALIAKEVSQDDHVERVFTDAGQIQRSGVSWLVSSAIWWMSRASTPACLRSAVRPESRRGS